MREWAAKPNTPDIRKRYFGPLTDVATAIVQQQGEKWGRELFERHLTGLHDATDRYRRVAGRDYRKPDAEPLLVELFDHSNKSKRNKTIAIVSSVVVQRLMKQMNGGWNAATLSRTRCRRAKPPGNPSVKPIGKPIREGSGISKARG